MVPGVAIRRVVAGSAVAGAAVAGSVVVGSAVARVVFGCGYCGDILLFGRQDEEAAATKVDRQAAQTISSTYPLPRRTCR